MHFIFTHFHISHISQLRRLTAWVGVPGCSISVKSVIYIHWQCNQMTDIRTYTHSLSVNALSMTGTQWILRRVGVRLEYTLYSLLIHCRARYTHSFLGISFLSQATYWYAYGEVSGTCRARGKHTWTGRRHYTSAQTVPKFRGRTRKPWAVRQQCAFLPSHFYPSFLNSRGTASVHEMALALQNAT